ncbi:MAG TPA: DUF308 domain-containing protein [Frankiaceae bacterium]|nr:DUF308 domain-containing protein [Frankiaceae bacterium]
MTSATAGPGRAVGMTEHAWLLPVVLGAGTVVLGLVVMANPFATARTLAILVAIGLLVHGLLDGLRARRAPRPAAAFAAAGLLVLGGIVALVWPGITLWILAVVVGMSIVLSGAVKATAAVADRHEFSGWPLLLISGILSLVIGVVAVAWPKATIVVLAVLFGLQLAVVGLVEIAAGLELRRALKAAA